MKNIKLFTTILLTASTLALTACGNTAPTVSAEETIKNQVVENTTTTESETAVIESVMPETTETAIESEMASEEEIIDPNYNGTHAEETLQETEQTYIQYTDIEPTTMYVINTNNMDVSTYRDPNITGGVLMQGGVVESNQEIIIDGKATYNNTDYYRIAYKEGSMIDYQLIIPADYLTTEKQTEQAPVETEKPVETQKPVEQQPQQPEVQQPEVQQPVAEPSTPGYDPSCGISEEDWNKLFGGGNSNTNHNWQPNRSEGFTVDENGNITLGEDSTVDRDKIGSLTFH